MLAAGAAATRLVAGATLVGAADAASVPTTPSAATTHKVLISFTAISCLLIRYALPAPYMFGPDILSLAARA